MDRIKGPGCRRTLSAFCFLFFVVPARAELQGGDTFRVRIGATGDESAHVIVGSREEARTVLLPVKLRRFRGRDPLDIQISSEVISGDPSRWTVLTSASFVKLGPGGTTSTADVDRDGDVDDDDLAVFETCFSGDGVTYPDPSQCVAFDFDGDLDVDGGDRARFEQERTPPRVLPVAEQIVVAVRAASNAPDGEFAKIRITASAPQTGESHGVNINVTKQIHALRLDTTITPELTKARSDQLVHGRTAVFNLDVFNVGAEEDLVFLYAEAAPGFAFSFSNTAGEPQRLYRLGRAGTRSGESPPMKRSFQLLVTTPPGWPRLSEQTVTVVAHSLTSGRTARQELQLTRAGLLWTPSDLFSPRGRRHYLRPGSQTTYVLKVSNILSEERTYRLFPVMASPASGWTLQLSRAELTLSGGEQTEVLASLVAPGGAQPGAVSDWHVVLTDAASLAQITPQSVVSVARVGGQVTQHRKIVQLGIDGFPPDYLYLNREATGPGSDGDWLMPNIRSLLESSTSYANARVLLPAFTDANHANALTGSLTGTSGASSVIFYYVGEDEDGAAVVEHNDETMLRHGPSGDPVLSLFDVAKTENPGAHTAMVLGKNWIAHYFEKEVGGVDVVVNGLTTPSYVAPPERYVLGDPPSDSDAEQDPPSKSGLPEWGNFPGVYPDDRWVFEQAKRVILNEDPDVIYIQPAHPDDVQHLMGTAFDPSEWDDRGTATKWDDVSRVNPLATREEVLDVMRELDLLVGDLLEFLEQRGTLDDTYLVLHSDHGLVTEAPATMDIRRLLEPAGFSLRDHYYAGGGGGFVLIYDVDPARAEEFEAVLEQGPSITPGQTANPWTVINREEMRTGVDAYTGRAWGVPRELYSTFFIDHADADTASQRWPSFFVFLDGHWQSANLLIQRGDDSEIPLFIGSHGGFASQRIPLMLRGPGIPGGQVVTDEVLVSDVAPTLYILQGWSAPANVDGQVLPGIAPPASPER